MRYTSIMNHAGKIAVGLAGLLSLHASLHADDVVLPGNPYAPVVARNIFGLNPAPVVDPNASIDPPPKITPNGIMSIFGQLQVLFKVSGKAGGKDTFYTLSQGQRQDDIEVTKIDEKNGIVTFNNHGSVQELPLAAAPALTLPTAAGQPGMAPGVIAPSPFGGPGGPGNGRSRHNGGFNGRGGNNQDNSGDNGSNLRAVPTRIYQPEQSQMTPEMQVIAIEANREQLKAQGSPIANLLPPTVMTPPSNDGNGPPAP